MRGFQDKKVKRMDKEPGWKKYRREVFENLGINYRFWLYYVVPTVLERDNHTCQGLECGAKKTLDVAHLIYHANISIKNLITLCRKCHKKHDKELGVYVQYQ